MMAIRLCEHADGQSDSKSGEHLITLAQAGCGKNGPAQDANLPGQETWLPGNSDKFGQVRTSSDKQVDRRRCRVMT